MCANRRQADPHVLRSQGASYPKEQQVYLAGRNQAPLSERRVVCALGSADA